MLTTTTTTTTRRHFLQAVLATAAAGMTVPRWMQEAAAAPLGPADGVLVVVTLRGGCDPLGVLVPRAGERRSHYEAARGEIALAADTLLNIDPELGLSPELPRLAQRFAAGDVALVPGVGLPASERSHFAATDLMRSGAGTVQSTGWLGRHLDGLAGSGGVHGLTVSTSVPHHLRGAAADVVALPLDLHLWGSDTTRRFERAAHDAIRAFAEEPTGAGPWGDRIAAAGAHAVDAAAVVGPAAAIKPDPNRLARDLETAAQVINADVGARALAVETGGYDTHAMQHQAMPVLLADLDAALEGFWTSLDAGRHGQTAVLVVSEFGRTVAANSSLGTDHGHAGMTMLVGPNVAGGIHGELPSLVDLDDRGNLVPSVDHREVYATAIDQWLGGDASSVLGGSFPTLDLFAAPPGA